VTAPRIDAVEPPSWWLGTRHPRLRLLLRGAGLEGARVAVEGDGIAVRADRWTPGGEYVFVDLSVEPGARPGPRRLVATTRAGRATANFALAPRAAPRTRALGLDDVLYLAVPDRFRDGDPGNNRPRGAEDLYDPRRPRHFHGGDLAGLRKALPYLADLGATAVWTTPIVANSARPHPTVTYAGEPAIDYHGYGAVDGYAVSPHLGTHADLRALVAECRSRGIALLQDQVANHVGPAHRWADRPPTPTWIHRRTPNAFRGADILSPYASPAARRRTLDGWFADLLPDLNQDDPECATWLIQNALWWVGTFGFGGIRQDTVPYVPTEFWHRWSRALRTEFPGISLLGEVNYYEPAMVAHWMRGGLPRRARDAGFDQGYDFPLHGALRHVFAENGPLSSLSDTLARDPVYPEPERLVTFVGLHDTPRFASLAPAWALPLAFTFVFLSRGIPLVYYGDEIGMLGKDDPETRAHFPGGFPGDDRNAFLPAGRAPGEQALRATVAALARLRRTVPAFQARSATTYVLAGDERLAWIRGARFDGNAKEGDHLCAIRRDALPGPVEIESVGTFELPSRTAGVWRRERGTWRPLAVVDANGFRARG